MTITGGGEGGCPGLCHIYIYVVLVPCAIYMWSSVAQELLALWPSEDPRAQEILQANREGIEAFLEDHPEFRQAVYWSHVSLVASIFGRFGLCNPDGSRAVYSFCSHIRHSCRPNAAWFALRKGFPPGKRMLHVIDLEGIQRGEEITVAQLEEDLLLRPKLERSRALKGCGCVRCAAGDEEADARHGDLSKSGARQGSEGRRCPGFEHVSCAEDEKIRHLFGKLSKYLATQPPTDNSTNMASECLRELDRLLPFSMRCKAKAKVLLAAALGELSQRAAWQQDNRPANIIRWTGLDAESQEQRLREAKRLYETAGKDFEYLLGQEALPILQRMESGYGPVQDQQKMLSKYSRHPKACSHGIPLGF